MATRKQIEHYEQMLKDAQDADFIAPAPRALQCRCVLPEMDAETMRRVAEDGQKNLTAMIEMLDFDNPQQNFESLANEMGLLPGALARVEGEDRYCNEHVQWLWEQFQRKEK